MTNPPSQAEKLKQEMSALFKQRIQPPYPDADRALLTHEVMTAIADYISGIELPNKKELAPNGYSERVGFNQAITQLEKALKDIEKELRK